MAVHAVHCCHICLTRQHGHVHADLAIDGRACCTLLPYMPYTPTWSRTCRLGYRWPCMLYIVAIYALHANMVTYMPTWLSMAVHAVHCCRICLTRQHVHVHADLAIDGRACCTLLPYMPYTPTCSRTCRLGYRWPCML